MRDWQVVFFWIAFTVWAIANFAAWSWLLDSVILAFVGGFLTTLFLPDLADYIVYHVTRLFR